MSAFIFRYTSSRGALGWGGLKFDGIVIITYSVRRQACYLWTADLLWQIAWRAHREQPAAEQNQGKTQKLILYLSDCDLNLWEATSVVLLSFLWQAKAWWLLIEWWLLGWYAFLLLAESTARITSPKSLSIQQFWAQTSQSFERWGWYTAEQNPFPLFYGWLYFWFPHRPLVQLLGNLSHCFLWTLSIQFNSVIHQRWATVAHSTLKSPRSNVKKKKHATMQIHNICTFRAFFLRENVP